MALHKRSTKLICPLTASDIAGMREQMKHALLSGADAVECRLDFLAKMPDKADLGKLLENTPLETIVTYRPKRQGGKFDGDEKARLKILKNAAEFSPAYIDLEIDVPREDWPDAAIILSHHDFHAIPENLDSLAIKLDASEAQVNKVAFLAGGPEDALRAFDVIRTCRKPTLAIAMGPAGVISRILAKKFGAFGIFASLEPESASAPGQLTIAELKNLYQWDHIDSSTEVYGVIGCPIGHSLSPAIHNAAFAAAWHNAVYVPLLVQPGEDNFFRFMDELLKRPWADFRGMSVTIPHKANALAYIGAENCDELVAEIGAANTLLISPNGKVYGYNSDYASAIDALCETMGIEREELKERKVAVMGAGGAARAIIAALSHYGARTTIYNRTLSKAEDLAAEFSAQAGPLEAAEKAEAEILINCTSIGMYPDIEQSPVSNIPPAAKVVFDTIYNPLETRLLKLARAAGCRTVSGLEMFVNQAVAQFEIWMAGPSGQIAAPREVMRNVVLKKLSS